MIDTWSAERAFEKFVNAMDNDEIGAEEIDRLQQRVYYEIVSIADDHNCSEDCDECARIIEPEPIGLEIIEDDIHKLRMGYTTTETHLEMLERIRREITNG